eukprot:14136610-Alexandrium_andersonii.AAC.1
MSASLVGSEMCIRDRVKAPPLAIAVAAPPPRPPPPVVALRRSGPAEDYCVFLEGLVKMQQPSVKAVEALIRN